MHLVVQTEPGVLELAFSWLPSWVGLNTKLKEDIEKELKEKIVGRKLTEEVLLDIDDLIISYLEKRFPIPGLRDYLDGLKFVQL